MSWLHRLANTFRAGRIEREIDRELAFHIAERVKALVAQASRPTRRARCRSELLKHVSEIEKFVHHRAEPRLIERLAENLGHLGGAIRQLDHAQVATLLTDRLGIGQESVTEVDRVHARDRAVPDGVQRAMRKTSCTGRLGSSLCSRQTGCGRGSPSGSDTR
jgi:hypothetical protein